MNEADINQLNRYLYQELEDCTRMIKIMKQMKLDHSDLTEKSNRLGQHIAVSLNKLEAMWKEENKTTKV